MNAICCFVVLLCTGSVNEQFKMVLNDDGNISIGTKVLNKSESVEILRNQQIRKLLNLSIKLLVAFCLCCFYLLVWYHHHYCLSIVSFVFWFVLFPVFFYYIVYALFSTILYVILASMYIQMMQKSILNKLIRLSKFNCAQSTNHHIRATYRLYLKINRDTIDLTKIIQYYSRYCSPILSVVFPFYILIQSYPLYTILFIDAVPLIVKQVFGVAVLEFNFFTLLINIQCALVVKLNKRIQVANRQIYVNFFVKQNENNKVSATKPPIKLALHKYSSFVSEM